MIIEVRKKTKNAKELIVKCDFCNKFYVTFFKNITLNKEYHFCSVDCVNQSKKSDGLLGIKYKNTCLLKYGVENTFQDVSVKQKIKNTIQLNYGVDNCSQAEFVKIKKKITCNKNYGVDVPLQSSKIMEKYVNTFMSTYGVINPSQDSKIFDRAQQNMKGSHETGFIEIAENNIFYRSSYEKQFLFKLKKFINEHKGIICIPNIAIDYLFKNKNRKYFCDYLVIYKNESVLFEIKPKSLLNLPLNKIKFKAAENFVVENNMKCFVILTEEELFNDNFSLQKFF